MEHQTRQQAIDHINDICEQAGCNERLTKLHQAQYVDRSWHPHPPAKFVSWWMQHKNFVDDGVDVVRAYNCRNFREEFKQGGGERYDLPPGDGKKLSENEIRSMFTDMVSTLDRQFGMNIKIKIPNQNFRDPIVEGAPVPEV